MLADAYGPQGRSSWMDVDWREHQRWLRIDGRAINLVDLGSGPPLVFVHGLGGCWQNWLENLLPFAGDHRVIAMDLPGFGQSEMPAEKITVSGYGTWLDRLLDELGVEAAAIVGNSMGGFIGLETAIKFPHRVERLALVSAAGLTIENQRNEKGIALLYAIEELSQWLTALVIKRSGALVSRPRGRRALLWFVAKHPDRLPPQLVWEEVQAAGKPGFLPALDALTSYPIRDRLADVRCPTLIVWGSDDLLVPLRDAYEFERLIADSRVVVYADTGHIPQLERPERFNADLRAFLSEASERQDERELAAAAPGGRDASR